MFRWMVCAGRRRRQDGADQRIPRAYSPAGELTGSRRGQSERPLSGFELIEHTADVGIAADGDTFADALAWVAIGMFSIIADLDLVGENSSVDVHVESPDRDSLVVGWLNELLYIFDAHQFLPKTFEVSVNQDLTGLTASCSGEPVDLYRHIFYTDVKAATYHDLEVTSGAGWNIRVVLDV